MRAAYKWQVQKDVSVVDEQLNAGLWDDQNVDEKWILNPLDHNELGRLRLSRGSGLVWDHFDFYVNFSSILSLSDEKLELFWKISYTDTLLKIWDFSKISNWIFK